MTYNSKQYQAEYYQQNKEKLQKQNKEWANKNKERDKELKRISWHRRKNDPLNIKKILLKWAKSRATKKGLIFNLTEEDIILPEICPIMKVPFDRSNRKYAYSLDRKDPNKGYTKDNVWVISQIANAMKWDSTKEEREAFAYWVLSLEGGKIA